MSVHISERAIDVGGYRCMSLSRSRSVIDVGGNQATGCPAHWAWSLYALDAVLAERE